MAVPKKLRTELLNDPAILLLGIQPRGEKVGTHTCVPVLIAALVITAQEWRQLTCPLTNEWVGKGGMCVQWTIIRC